jgi:serine/threonine protein kinase
MSNLPPRYLLGDALGHGGMGTVLLAEDTQLGRKVAVKFLSGKLEDDRTARERLHREARSAAALDHPYICKIHEIVVIDGRTGIVMEYVPGETLQTRLRRSAFAVAEALTIAGEVAEAMDAAHRRHVIHRDLKPSNIMLAESGHVKVMDFGLAKAISPDGVEGAPETVLPLTEVGLRLGTPRYMSPEQILGQEADARSDIFAFGMLFYELMTSTHPFDDPSSAGTMAAILRDPPKPLAHARSGLPPFAQHMIDRLLAKDPARRYQSFRDVWADVEQLRRDLTPTTVPGNTTPAAASMDATRTSVGSSRASSTTEERRQITVIFCEMDGLRDMSSSLDAEDLLELGEQYRSIWQGQIERFGGTTGVYIDGALYGYFGYPIAHEHDARRALLCGLAIQSEVDTLVNKAGQTGITRPSVRVGINTGFAIVAQQNGVTQVHGNTGAMAARLAELSAGGSVVASGATMRVAGPGFDYKSLGNQRIRGFTDPVPLYEVVAERDPRARLDSLSPVDLPALVGRDLELSMLRQHWTQARDGQGSVVLVSGEAGIGKSRLVDSFVRGIAADDEVWVESLYCSPLNSSSPFFPLIQHLENQIWPTSGKHERDALADLRSFLAGVGAESDHASFLLSKLLSVDLPAAFPAPSLAPAAQQAKTAQLLLQLLTHPQRGPRGLIVINDLHWADPSTLGWLDLLVGQVPVQPLMVLVTARPPCHPAWLSRPRTSAITLGRLKADDILVICRATSSGMRLPPEILQHVVDKTDGIPLFAEELTSMILESGILEAADDHYVLKGPVPMHAIPTTLQGSLIARLDSLSEAKYVAEIGAVVGRRFSFEILQALSGEREHVLSQHLQKLVDAELLFQSGFVPDASYTFKHALIQDAAYNGMLRARRAELHEKVAVALDAREAADHPEVVAYHYARAGKSAKAAELYRLAGQQAMARYANAEAIQHLDAALEQLRQSPESMERDVDELAIVTLLGPARNMIKGYLDPEAEAILTRATELCRDVDDPEPLVFALVGLSTTHMIRAQYSRAFDAATKIGETARVTGKNEYEVMGKTILSCVSLFTGQLGEATQYATEVGRLYHNVAGKRLALLGWGTLDIACRCYGAFATSLLGYPDRAAEQNTMTITNAGTSEYHFDIYHGHLYAALARLAERNWAACQQTMSEYLPLAQAYGDPFPLAISTIVHRFSLRGPGYGDAIHEAGALMEQLRAGGYGLGYSFLLGQFAEGALHYGNVDAAEAAVREAYEHLDKTGPELWEAEIHRLNGDVLRELGEPAAVVARSYMRAVEVAQRQAAKLLELRAATSLVRVLAGCDDEESARQRLRSVYDWFTEGFDTVDLVDARRVLGDRTAQ